MKLFFTAHGIGKIRARLFVRGLLNASADFIVIILGGLFVFFPPIRDLVPKRRVLLGFGGRGGCNFGQGLSTGVIHE